ncbi:MAG: class I SAM-dependent methyltransferase [Eubacteriaceae bacterium]|nr:class I SAM-dependent methyltransferase [Eubacteriaceae bacterium]
MLKLFERQTTLAKAFIEEGLKPGDSAIDATAGHGDDTLFLAEAVGEEGTVYSFDVQSDALRKTREKCEANHCAKRVQFFQKGHETISDNPEIRQDSKIKAIMFNLGYLPGGDHEITTRVDTTLAAVQGALNVLSCGGRMTICVYGHPSGQEEMAGLTKMLPQLGHAFNVYEIKTCNHQQAPVLFVIEKKKEEAKKISDEGK